MRTVRCLAVQAAATLATLAVGGVLADGLATPPTTAADAVVRLASVALLACLAWVWLAVVTVAVDALRRRPEGSRLSRPAPAGLRRVVLAACGVAVGAGWTLASALPAGATADAPVPAHSRLIGSDPHDGEAGSTVRLDGLPLPSLPRTPSGAAPTRPTNAPTAAPMTASPAPSPDPAPAPADGTRPADLKKPGQAPRGADRYQVRPGDSLWSITADLLGPRATTSDIARAWPMIHRANAELIGPDPDLLHPGTRLVVPSSLGRILR